MQLRRLLVLAALFASPLATGCRAPIEARVYAGPLRVRVMSPELELSNTTTDAIYYKIIEHETATLIDWMPCTDPLSCDAVRVGETKAVPYSSIVGYKAGSTEAIVYWWHLEAKPSGGYTTKGLAAIPIRL